MTKFLKFIFLTLIFFFIFASPAKAIAEDIKDYTVKLNINKNGTVNVSEKINYDFGDLEKHGIYRTIPTIRTNEDGKKYQLDVSNISVTDENNNSYQYQTSYQGSNNDLSLKIGDPDHTITGLHIYIIDYTIRGDITYFSDHDELYWNVTGVDWDVQIQNVTAQVLLPENLKENDIKTTCYTGPFGSTSHYCKSNIDNNVISFQTTQPLYPHENLSVVAGFPKNIVAVLEPKEYIPFGETGMGKIIIIIFIIAITIIGIFWYIFYPFRIIYKWYRYGRDPKALLGVTSAWFDPPTTQTKRKLTPGETGALIDETVDLRDIAATLVDLARRGYIKIIEPKKNDFYIEKVKESKKSDLEPFEKILLSGIFHKKDKIKIKDSELVEVVNDTKTALYESLVKENFFPQNPDSIRKFYTVIWILAIVTFNPFLFIAALVFGTAMPRKTDFGAQAANIAKSLKNFLSSQERQFAFQAERQMMFERLLPFAIAFGVEKIWAERFKDIALTKPTWYEGYESGRFNTILFVSSLNSSFTSFNTAATPTKSSSGFSSGFSGGSSGGGGGGGGGGSW